MNLWCQDHNFFLEPLVLLEFYLARFSRNLRAHFTWGIAGLKNTFDIPNSSYFRNCVLEPFANDGRDALMCLEFIDAAIRWNKPAIISSHRVNYLGGIDNSNQDLGL